MAIEDKYYKTRKDGKAYVIDPSNESTLSDAQVGSLGLNINLIKEQAPENIPLSQSGQFYKVGGDVFSTATNQPVSLLDFKTQGLNLQFIPNKSSTSIKNNINTDANKITSSTGLRVSAPSSVFGTPMLQNPPTLSPDIFGASASGTATAKGTPTQEAYQAEIKRLQAEQTAISEKASKGLAGLFTEAPKQMDFTEINKQALASLGLPADFTQTQFGLLNRTATEIDTLNKQMTDLSVQEQNAYMRTESQAIPMDSINGQKSQIERQYAIKKSGLAAEITAKAAYSESLRGNFTLVNQLVEKTASLATQAKAQEIADYKWMFENYQEEFKALTNREQDLYGDLLSSLEQEQKDAKTELTQKMNMFISAKVPIPDMVNLTNMSVEEVAKYVTNNRPVEDKDTKTTAAISEYNLAVSQGFKGTFQEWKQGAGSQEALPFVDVMQAAIDAGATPEQAAREAALVSENSGIQVDQKTLSSWVATAKTLSRTPLPPVQEEPAPIKLKAKDIGKALSPQGISDAAVPIVKTLSNVVKSGASAAGNFFKGLFGF